MNLASLETHILFHSTFSTAIITLIWGSGIQTLARISIIIQQIQRLGNTGLKKGLYTNYILYITLERYDQKFRLVAHEEGLQCQERNFLWSICLQNNNVLKSKMLMPGIDKSRGQKKAEKDCVEKSFERKVSRTLLIPQQTLSI